VNLCCHFNFLTIARRFVSWLSNQIKSNQISFILYTDKIGDIHKLISGLIVTCFTWNGLGGSFFGYLQEHHVFPRFFLKIILKCGFRALIFSLLPLFSGFVGKILRKAQN
jgi:hypothetical protein